MLNLPNNIMTQVREPIKDSSVVKYWLIAPGFISPYLLGLILPPVYWKRLLLLTTHLPTFFVAFYNQSYEDDFVNRGP